MASYNPGRFLQAALESVFAQTLDRWHLILVDDASTDHSLARCRPLLRDRRVTVLHNPGNQGQAASLNHALRRVSTDWMIQLDSDDWLAEDALEVLYAEALEQPEDVAVVSGNIRFHFQGPDGRDRSIADMRGRSFDDRYDFLLANLSLWPRCYRVSAVRDMGGWPVDDPFDGRYVEDLRILYRLIERYRFHWVDRLLYHHRRHSRNQTLEFPAVARAKAWAVRDALHRWGDEYEPVFERVGGGYLNLVRLVRKRRA